VGYLRAHVKGFFVEMPLDWGNGETKTPPPPLHSDSMIAEQPKQDRKLDPFNADEREEAVT